MYCAAVVTGLKGAFGKPDGLIEPAEPWLGTQFSSHIMVHASDLDLW